MFKFLFKNKNKKIREDKIKEEINKQIEIDKKNCSMEQIYHILNIVDCIESRNRELRYLKVPIDYNQIERLFTSVYKDTYMINEVSSFEKYVNENIRKLIYEYLNINKNGFRPDTIELVNYELDKYDSSKWIYDILNNCKADNSESYNNYEETELSEYKKNFLEDGISDNSNDYYLARLIVFIVNYIIGIIYLIILSRKKYKFIDNNELVILSRNLYEEFDENEAIEKLFEIYKDLYDDELICIENEGIDRQTQITNSKKLNLEIMTRFSAEYMNFDLFKSFKRFKSFDVVEFLELIKYMFEDKYESNKLDKLSSEDFEEIIYYAYDKNIYEMKMIREFYSFMIINYMNTLDEKDLINITFNWKSV